MSMNKVAYITLISDKWDLQKYKNLQIDCYDFVYIAMPHSG